MWILAFDTSGFAGSVALLSADGLTSQVVAERKLDPARRSAQTLAPAMAEVLAEAGIQPTDVRLVATTIGPGSFTGLRVAATAAKTFAYAAGCDVVGLSTLDVIAAQAGGQGTGVGGRESEDTLPSPLAGEGPGVKGSTANEPEIHAVIDAQRKELFLARYRISPNGPERLAPDAIIPAQSWLDSLALGTIVTGPGLEKLDSRLPPMVIAVPKPLREPQAVTAGHLAWHAYQSGRRDDLWKLAPAYLRPSYAEEKARI
jgi:tRNA threonylcarbamoyladenosine biosynthesis protein TsaB